MLCDLILAYSMNFGPFFNWVVCFLIVEFKISWCILQRCPISDMCFARTSVSVCGSPFHFINIVFYRGEVFLILMNSQPVNTPFFFLFLIMLLVLYLRHHYKVKDCLDFPASTLCFYILHLRE